MYAGRIVEATDTAELFDGMRHPYTQALLASIPQLDQDTRQALFSHPRPAARPRRPADRLPVRAPVPLVQTDCRESDPPLDGQDGVHTYRLLPPGRRPAAAAGRRARRSSEQPGASTVARERAVAPDRPIWCGSSRSGAAAAAAAGHGEGGLRRVVHGRTPARLRPGRRVRVWQDDPRPADRRRWRRPTAAAVCSTGTTSGRCAARELRRRRRDLQMMFQDPYA